jgi:hypothetical protein
VTLSSGLKHLVLTDNRGLGPEGMAAIAAALPATLETLHIPDKIAEPRPWQLLYPSLPDCVFSICLTTGPSELQVGRQSLPLYPTLPKLPALEDLRVTGCPGFGDAERAALRAVRPQCAPSLSVECSVRGRDERWALEPGGGSGSDEDSEDGNDLSDESLSDDE